MLGRHLICPTDFSVLELEELFTLADDIIKNTDKYSKICDGKIMATLFYEPSTRTRLSFEGAMLRLGGKILGFSDPQSSSVTKGESVADTIRMVGCYADIAAMRHPTEGTPKAASLYSQIPLINAGDGGHEHPTQTLTDLYTIRAQKGKLDNLTLGICGDLKFGRTVHSLIKAMSRYQNINFVLISPPELKIPSYVREMLKENGNVTFKEESDLESCIKDLDILYMTRIQRERFSSQDEYNRLKGCYILDAEKMKQAKDDMIILHPLPRVNEIATDVDGDKRACYFVQAQYGMFVRMALIIKLLGVLNKGNDISGAKLHKTTLPIPVATAERGVCCQNPKCIATIEETLPQRTYKKADGTIACEYCDCTIGL